MEKQKVFWVVLAVSVFVVVVLIVGVLMLRQHPGTAPRATITPMNDSGTQVFEYSKPEPQTPAAPGTGPQASAPSSGDQQTMHFYIGEGQPPATTPGAVTPPAGQTPGAATSGQPPAASAPAPAPAAPSVPSAPAATAARSRTATRPPAIARTPRKTAEYWIQAGAYKSQSKAEELVSQLQGKGLSSRVFSYTSGSDTFYRVRVGPYTNRGEADKFLGFVKHVRGLESSYISMTAASKSVVN